MSKVRLKRVFRIIKNINVNLYKKFDHLTSRNDTMNFIRKYKFIISIATVLIILISKNVYLIYKYSSETKEYKQTLVLEKEKNKLLKEDLKYYNSEEFVYRYAMSELNMRPTKPSKFIHIEILPENNKDTETKEETSSEQNKEETTNNINTDTN